MTGHLGERDAAAGRLGGCGAATGAGLELLDAARRPG